MMVSCFCSCFVCLCSELRGARRAVVVTAWERKRLGAIDGSVEYFL